MVRVNIWDSFESPDANLRHSIIAENIVGKLRLESSELGLFGNEEFFVEQFDMVHPRLKEMIREYNRIVGSLNDSYTLLRHYFNKGIPDDPWYSPDGPYGELIKYYPLFEKEHWGRRYWFSYFSEIYYLLIFSLWDSVLKLIGHYYGYYFEENYRLKSEIIKMLKKDHSRILVEWTAIQDDPVYKTAKEYRKAAAYGVPLGSIMNTVQFEPKVEMVIPIREKGAGKKNKRKEEIMRKVSDSMLRKVSENTSQQNA